jgi:DNA (cytosine-5)-methyltransferase 1
MGSGGHNVPLIKDDNGIRKLTPRECFNLQGFPSTYELPSDLSDSKLYKLAGNAVSVPIVELIADRLFSKGKTVVKKPKITLKKKSPKSLQKPKITLKK